MDPHFQPGEEFFCKSARVAVTKINHAGTWTGVSASLFSVRCEVLGMVTSDPKG